MNNIIIGIAGPSASGKTMLAKTLESDFGNDVVSVITEDSYYKDTPNCSFKERTKINFDHPDSIDYELLYQQLNLIRTRVAVNIPIYNYSLYERDSSTRLITGKQGIIVVEGILIFTNEKIRNLMDIKVFIDTPLDICLCRRLKRDVIERSRSYESIINQYESNVKPMYSKFIEPTKKYADIIIPNGGKNNIATDMIRSNMKEILDSYKHYKVS